MSSQGGEKEFWCLFLFLWGHQPYWIKASTLWPHLTFIISYLPIQKLGLQHVNFGGGDTKIQSITSSFHIFPLDYCNRFLLDFPASVLYQAVHNTYCQVVYDLMCLITGFVNLSLLLTVKFLHCKVPSSSFVINRYLGEGSTWKLCKYPMLHLIFITSFIIYWCFLAELSINIMAAKWWFSNFIMIYTFISRHATLKRSFLFSPFKKKIHIRRDSWILFYLVDIIC